MSGKRWTSRKCSHGNPVQWRQQLDMAYCDEPDCLDKIMARMGWQRIPEFWAEKEAERAARLKEGR